MLQYFAYLEQQYFVCHSALLLAVVHYCSIFLLLEVAVLCLLQCIIACSICSTMQCIFCEIVVLGAVLYIPIYSEYSKSPSISLKKQRDTYLPLHSDYSQRQLNTCRCRIAPFPRHFYFISPTAVCCVQTGLFPLTFHVLY